MIYVYVDEDSKQPVIDFTGPLFDEVLSFVKSRKLHFDKTLSGFIGPAYKILALLDDLRDIDDVAIEDEDLEELDRLANQPSEIRKWRMPLNREIMKFTPIKGKPPHEKYQETDLKRLICTNRKGVFWDMGLGKTILMIGVLDQFFYQEMIEKVLIIVPSEGVGNWVHEIRKWSTQIDPERVQIADVDNRNPFTEDVDVAVMTYRTFLMISDDFYKKKTKGKGGAKKYRKPVIPFEEWGSDGKRVLISDESHSIRNPKARQTHVINLHSPFFEYRYLLTGTPADEVKHYYTQMRLLDPALIPEPFNDWISTVADVGDKFSQTTINYYHPDKVSEFLDRIDPYIISRKTEDHLHLPEKYIDKTYVQLGRKQRAIYQRVIADAMENIIGSNRGSAPTSQVVNKFPFLTLALDNPSILMESSAEWFSDQLVKDISKWKFSDHAKVPITESLLDQAFNEGRKVILWSGHPKTIDQLAAHFHKHKPYTLHGQMDFGGLTRSQFRDDVVESFKASSESNLLIASYKVLNAAKTITEVTRNIYFDRSYSLTEWLQSQKRSHRIGQTERVIVYPLIFDQSLDLRLDQRLSQKEDIDEKLLKRSQLTVEEWRAIFQGDTSIG